VWLVEEQMDGADVGDDHGSRSLELSLSAPISIVAWSPDGRRFAYASDNKTIEVWDTMTNLKLVTFSHTAPPRVMAWSLMENSLPLAAAIP